MNRRRFLNLAFISGASLILVSESSSADTASSKGDGSRLKWQKNLKAAQKIAIQQDKPMMIVFGASWCTYCHKLEKETLSEKSTTTMIDREFIPVHLDFDVDAKIAKILEVERLPCTVILSPDADLLSKTEGFAQPREYQKMLRSALEKRTEIQQVRATEGR